MIGFDFSNRCNGCLICGDVCPVNCISFVNDSDGFIVPRVDEKRCISCNKCNRFCPALKDIIIKPQEHKCYVVFHLDLSIRSAGSSGSVFYSLAEMIIQKGGVVYGAEMDENLRVKHQRIDTKKGIRRLMKSKYIQSDISGIYNSVLDDLKSNKDVLFVGTPCQCYALNHFIPSMWREHLLLVDFICHGVPSQSLFDKAIQHFECLNNCKVVKFSFREKNDTSLRNYKIVYKCSNGELNTQINNAYSFPFYFGYLNHWISRPSCYNCHFRRIDRISDLTIGDFWGITKILPKIKDFEKGYSLVITNSNRGIEHLSNIVNCYVKEITNGTEFVVENNYAYVHSDRIPLIRHFFFRDLSRKGWKFCESYYLQLSPPIKSRIMLGCINKMDQVNNMLCAKMKRK